MVLTSGENSLRAENISKIVTGFALQAYKMKQLCMEDNSSAWQETYYREGASELTGGASAAIRGVPRLAGFPHAEPSYTKVSSFIEKYGVEGTISAEDALTNNIPMIARTLLRIGRAVANAVDIQIEATLNADAGNALAVASGNEWDSATVANRDPVQDILNAKKLIAEDNYDTDNGNGYLVLSPKDYANLLGNTKIVSNPTFKAADIVANGVVGQLLGLKIIVSNVVTADQAYVVIAKEALTWKSVTPLTVKTIEDAGIKWTIRAWEMGVTQTPNPNAICEITNTAA